MGYSIFRPILKNVFSTLVVFFISSIVGNNVRKSSVRRQKGESQNGCFKKTKHVKFSEKRTFRTCVSGGKKCSFFGKSVVLCFLETPVLRFPLLPY